ncbi:MAG: hypothetical protein IAE90_13070 [Ignavibacteria bacterium]|nr:hypothetical protein [Ignavibacteria bacterium]
MEAQKFADAGLVCPLGKYPLTAEGSYLVCPNCGAKYPVRDGIAMMLAEDAALPAGINSVSELKCSKEK